MRASEKYNEDTQKKKEKKKKHETFGVRARRKN